MAQYDDIDEIDDLQESAAEHEARETMRRLVRTEIRRVESGEADEDIADDIAREEEAKKRAEEQKKKKSRFVAKIESLFTGDILLTEEASGAFNLLVLLGAIFLISIFAMFATFKQEMRHSQLQNEVELLKEHSVRTSEERTKQSTHSAILEKLKERGIQLEDPTVTPIDLR